MTLSWDDLRALEALDRLKDVRSAARETGQSVSTFYRRVAQLEEGLGQLCLNRRNNGAVTLTAFGQSLAQVGRRTRGGLSEVFSKLRADEELCEGPVSLTTVEAMVPFVAPALVALSRAHPKLTIELVPGDRGPSVRRREVDVALGVMTRPPEGCWGRKVGQLESGVFGVDECVKTGGPFLLRNETFSPEAQWERANINSEPAFRAPFHTLLSLCTVGAGLMLMPRPLAEQRHLVEATSFKGSTRELTRPVWCLTHPDLKKSPRVRAVFDALATCFS